MADDTISAELAACVAEVEAVLRKYDAAITTDVCGTPELVIGDEAVSFCPDFGKPFYGPWQETEAAPLTGVDPFDTAPGLPTWVCYDASLTRDGRLVLIGPEK